MLPCHPTSISRFSREQIAVFRAAGHPNAEIAKALGRAPATISRELRRNALSSGTYSPRLADGAYLERRQRAAILETDARLREFVVQRLSEGLSPEQIAGWLKGGAYVDSSDQIAVRLMIPPDE
ncbi:helix-turn-helix domain-containing protein [Fulvimarina sp. MAC3]|uniref:helix-turn-helix domain-containing protein n=1 Tax=Fulvimarina sp. MAC3 TaxID=3148887 RepID=UPI0031FC03AE